MNNELDHTTIDQAIEEDELPRKKRGRSTKIRTATRLQDDDAVLLHTHLAKCVGPLLEKFGAHAATLRSVLLLLCKLRLNAAHGWLRGKRFDELLVQLERATLKHTDRRTLLMCASAWFALMGQSGAPALQEAVQVRYRRLVAKLLANLQPLIQTLRQKTSGFPPALFEEAEVCLYRLEFLGREYAHASSHVNGVASALAHKVATSPDLMHGATTTAELTDGEKVSNPQIGMRASSMKDVVPLTSPLANCLASVLRTLMAQLIFAAEELRETLENGATCNMPNIHKVIHLQIGNFESDDHFRHKGHVPSMPRPQSSPDVDKAGKALIAACDELLPALLRTAGLSDYPCLQAVAIEMLCTVSLHPSTSQA